MSEARFERLVAWHCGSFLESGTIPTMEQGPSIGELFGRKIPWVNLRKLNRHSRIQRSAVQTTPLVVDNCARENGLSPVTSADENEPVARPVLIIDDDPDAVELARHALQRAKIPNPLISLSDGRAAISHLRHCATGTKEMPLFVFLDLNMPVVDGFYVLDWMRHQPALRRLITVVLSTSSNQRDVARAFELGADAYLPKFPPVSEINTIFQLANAMLSVEELEKTLWPGLKPRENTAAHRM
jgi:CheY-like chemotaxis protein